MVAKRGLRLGALANVGCTPCCLQFKNQTIAHSGVEFFCFPTFPPPPTMHFAMYPVCCSLARKAVNSALRLIPALPLLHYSWRALLFYVLSTCAFLWICKVGLFPCLRSFASLGRLLWVVVFVVLLAAAGVFPFSYLDTRRVGGRRLLLTADGEDCLLLKKSHLDSKTVWWASGFEVGGAERETPVSTNLAHWDAG